MCWIAQASASTCANALYNASQRLLLHRWFPTALWASTSTALTRWLPAAEPEAKAEPGKSWAWAPTGILAGTLRALTHSHGASQPLRSSAQEQSLSLEHKDDVHNGNFVPEAEGSARHAAEAPGAQRWLSWSAASANPASSSAQVRILISGLTHDWDITLELRIIPLLILSRVLGNTISHAREV